MVVDDSEEAHEIYQSFLAAEGHRTLAARSARAAIRLLASGAQPDLLVPVVVASGVAVPTALRLPAVRYLTKAFEEVELSSSIRDALQKGRGMS